MLTIKKKRPEAEATNTEAATIVARPPAPAASSVAQPPPPPGLEPVGDAPASGGAAAKSFTVFAILGIVLTLCVIAVIALQYTEYAFYKGNPAKGEPSAWLAK